MLVQTRAASLAGDPFVILESLLGSKPEAGSSDASWEKAAKYVDTVRQLREAGVDELDSVTACLEISTAHITAGDNELLMHHIKDLGRLPVRVGHTEYGYFVRTFDATDDRPRMLSFGLSAAFCDALAWAKDRGYTTVLFDRDAPTIEALPAFDW